jgi:hypothetical protein
MKRLTVSRDDIVYDWLEKHREVNKSGLFQKIAEYMMNNGRTSLEQNDIERAVGGLV